VVKVKGKLWTLVTIRLLGFVRLLLGIILVVFSDEEEEMTEKEVKRGLMGCLKFGLTSSLKDIVNKARGLRGNKIPWKSVIRHIWEEIKEKVSIRKVAKDIWQIARKKGWKFAVVAILLEMFEDIVLPGLAIVLGHPELAPMFLALHLEPIVYPIAMCILQ